MTVLLTLQEFLTCTQSPGSSFSEIYREYAVATQRRKLQRIIEKFTFPSDGNNTDSGDSLRFSEKLLRTSKYLRILFQLARSNELDYSAGGRSGLFRNFWKSLRIGCEVRPAGGYTKTLYDTLWHLQTFRPTMPPQIPSIVTLKTSKYPIYRDF